MHPIFDGVEALVFDVFGTTVDWRSSVFRELKEVGKKFSLEVSDDEWYAFADQWRAGYMINTQRVAEGGEGPKNTDVMHRQILDSLLSSEPFSKIGAALDENARADLNMVWHRLDTWPDVIPALQALKPHFLLIALSNGNLRLLVDMAKHAKLPWDTILATALFDSYKPNPIVYSSALSHLSLSSNPQKAIMVAAHMFDLRGAAKAGMKTIYVRSRGSEDSEEVRFGVRSKSESQDGAGEVDLVVENFDELVGLFKE